MARKTVGYVKLEWTCPNCNTRNPGPQKTCSSCGSPQPEDVQFEQAAQEELIKDEAEIAQAKAGPDVHCYYCGARNPAGATACSQCGADLSQATARASDQVLGAHRTGPAEKIPCPACGTPNEANAPKCVQCGASLAQPQPVPPVATPSRSRLGLYGAIIAGVLVLLVVVVCIAFFALSARTSDLQGQVESVSWTRTIAVEGLVPVTREDWRDEIPAGAPIGACTQELRTTQDEPAPGAVEVCGTPYTEDEGSGFGEVIQDCQYEIYADSCEYTVNEWQKVDEITLDGQDLSPQWPVARLGADQRESQRAETYKVVFRTEDGTYTYTTDDLSQFARYQPGSRWLLKVNAFNAVTAVEPISGQ